MTNQVVDKGSNLFLELRRFRLKLREGVCQSMRNLNIFAAQLTQEFHVVITGEAQRGSGFDHSHCKSESLRNFRTAINEIADKNRFASVWRLYIDTSADFLNRISEVVKES